MPVPVRPATPPGEPAPSPAAPVPDRWADAVRARRHELRAARTALGGDHRRELTSVLALSRLAAAARADERFAAVRAELRVLAETRAGRRTLPAALGRAVDAAVADLHGAWAAALAPALRRIATERGASVEPRLPRPLPAAALPAPEPLRPLRTLLTGTADGAVLWRLALLPLAALSGLPVWGLGGPRFAPLAVGIGLAAVLGAVAVRWAAADRLRLLRHVDAVLAAARAGVAADRARDLLHLERSTGAALDAAVAGRRAAVEAELRALTPGAGGA